MTLNNFVKTQTYKTLETFLLSDDEDLKNLVKPLFMHEFGKDIHLLTCMISLVYGFNFFINKHELENEEYIFYMTISKILILCSPYNYRENITNYKSIINYWLKYLEIITNNEK